MNGCSEYSIDPLTAKREYRYAKGGLLPFRTDPTAVLHGIGLSLPDRVCSLAYALHF